MSVPIHHSTRRDTVKHRLLLAGLVTVAAAATGVTAWVIESQSETTSESKDPSSVHDEANRYVQTGILQDKNHDYQAAAGSYVHALQLEPQNKVAWYNLGVAAHEVGNTAGARAAYERALKIDPAFPPALFNEALLLERSRPDQAVALLERATAADPKAATAHLHLGFIWARKGHDRTAVDEFRRAVATDPSLLSQVPEKFKESARSSSTSTGPKNGS